MTTATAGQVLNRDLLTHLTAHLDTHRGEHTGDEWGLRIDGLDVHDRIELLSPAATICVLAGLELGWTGVDADDCRDYWPAGVSASAYLACDPVRGWQPISQVAAELVGVDPAGAVADRLLWKPLTVDAVIAVITNLLEDTEN